MNLKGKIAVLYYCLKKSFSDMRQLSKGQKSNYELLQLSHRIEKGLLISNPKPLWGWDKAYRIAELLRTNDDHFSSKTANAVLSAFLIAKSKSQYVEDRQKYQEFMDKTHFVIENTVDIGGTVKIEKPTFTLEDLSAIEKLFTTRHSCRTFEEKPIPNEVIEHAVKLAMRCPSACNRQPYKVYVITPSVLEEKLGHKLQYISEKVLIITGDVRAFTSGEMLDWLISPTIFASYLTLSLHSMGIGSCVIRKDLVRTPKYNDAIMRITDMDASERIILEMFIGYYKNEFTVPISNRAGVEDVIMYY